MDRHQLRTQITAIFPNVYLSRQTTPTLDDRIVAAWLWQWIFAPTGGST